MDAVSAVGLAGSVVGIVSILAKSVNFLLNLQTKYKHADLTVSLLIGQLSTLKAALGQISEWITSSLVAVPQHEQLVLDLTISIQGCKILVSALDDRINSFDRNAAHTLNSLGKAQLLWDENGTTDYLNHLSNQISALNLLLTAFQCRSLFEQRHILQSDESRRIVKLVEDDMSSLLWLRDENSRHSRISILTENSQMLDAVFDFDREIFNSKAYQVAMRSNMRKALSKKTETMAQPELSPLRTSTNAFDHVQLNHNENAQTVRDERLGLSSSRDPVQSNDNEDAQTLREVRVGLLSSGDHVRVDDNEIAQTVKEERSGLLPSGDHLQLNDSEDPRTIREERLGSLPYNDKPIGELRLGAGEILVSHVLNVRVEVAPAVTREPARSSLNENIPLNNDVMDHQAEKPANLAVRRLIPARKSRVLTKLRDSPASLTSFNDEDVGVVSTRRMARRMLSFLPNGLNLRTPYVSAALQRSHEIDEQLRIYNEKKTNLNVLILGTSQSGKSVLSNSMKIFQDGNAFSSDFRRTFKEVIFTKMVKDMRIILENMKDLDFPVDCQNLDDHVQTIFGQSAEIESLLDSDLVLAIGALWGESGLREYLRSERCQMIRSCTYYFDSLARIALPDYVPTIQDILRLWIKTTGITETNLRLERHTCKIFDVGGTRSERKTWSHCFENAAVIIHLVDISDYDEALYEDGRTNRMQESLALFDSICNSGRLLNTSIALFFTKIDCLEGKLAISPFKTYFSDFSGDPTDIEDVKDYIRMRFLALNKNPEKNIDVYFINLLSGTNPADETALAIIENILDVRDRKERERDETGI